jgi:hypothetical protein
MDTVENRNTQNISWWITSLAISVICCAILFIIFAGYLMDIKSNLSENRLRIDIAERRASEFSTEIDSLRRRTTVQQIQVVPSGMPVQLPVSVLPAASDPATTAQPVAAMPATPETH